MSKITIDRSLLEQALEALKDNREDVSRGESGRYMMQHYDPAIAALREALAQPQQDKYTYASKQATMCAGCGEHKHTPLRIDEMGGYVCLTCIDQKFGSLLGEFGYIDQAQPQQEPVGEVTDALGDAFKCEFKGPLSVGTKLYTHPPAQQQCEWPTCQSEEYQQAIAKEVGRELVGEQPAQQNKGCALLAAQAEIERLRADLKAMEGFAELWYFVSDEVPLEFEQIVAEYPSGRWMTEAHKLRAAKEQR